MKWIFCWIAFLSFFPASAAVTMAEQMRSDGRIYVVIAVMLTILLGIALYLFRIDRKLSRLEKQEPNN
jgi:hypothetical protein